MHGFTDVDSQSDTMDGHQGPGQLLGGQGLMLAPGMSSSADADCMAAGEAPAALQAGRVRQKRQPGSMALRAGVPFVSWQVAGIRNSGPKASWK